MRELTPLLFNFDLPIMPSFQTAPDTNNPFMRAIQDQYNVLSLAVQNIIAVSSEDIYSTKSTEKKLASSDTKESNSVFLPLEEDVDFKEVLNRFSEETRSLSAENFLAAPVRNISKSLGRKYLNRSFNTFPIIDEGRSSILYFILICF